MKICGNCENRSRCKKFMIFGYASNYAERCREFEEKLKHCPFCGRTDLDDVVVAEIPERHYIGCPTCDFGFVRDTREEALKKWNTRTTENLGR